LPEGARFGYRCPMNPGDKASQRIVKFAPLAEIYAKIDALAPVPASEARADVALGRVLAADASATSALPPQAIALRDGWAVRSDAVLDAGPYAPAPLAEKPRWVEVGDNIPNNMDAILPPEAFVLKEKGAEALAGAAPGEGILAAGADAAAGFVLRRSGERLRLVDLALLRAAGIKTVNIRAPRIGLVCAKKITGDDTLTPTFSRLIEASGGIAEIQPAASLEQSFSDQRVDAVFVLGGSGAGRNDKSVLTLARVGRVEFHGLALLPGETAAFGMAAKPVLILPGRFDAALAVFLTLGRRLIARLVDAQEDEPKIPLKLTRKITSQPGFAEFVALRREKDGAVPSSSGPSTLAALARADGWLLVPPESEGYPAGAIVEMRLFP
jgi:molybdopterin molybdotransferase